MTAGTGPADPFAGRADDAHTRAARALAARLARAFPRAGIGITGSVAAGTHHVGSDLDMVVACDSFRHDAQMQTRMGDVPAAVVCLRPDGGPARARAWALAAGGDAHLVSMVRSARPLRDPEGCLERLQRAVAACDAERTGPGADALASLLRERAAGLVRALDGAAVPEPLLVRLLSVVVDGWCLREGVRRDSKELGRRLLATISAADPPLGEALRAAVPVTAAARQPLLRAFGLVFPAPADGGFQSA